MLERLSQNPTITIAMKWILPALAVLLTACQKPAATLQYKITATRPHDKECYTQGLEFFNGRLFESGGQYGESTVREVNPETGEVIRKRPMAKNTFAEGLTIFNNELWVLTWKEHTVNVLEPDTFRFIRSHDLKGEGWGLTHDDKHLILSDGSSTIQFMNPKDFSVVKTITVKDGGREISQLNELEFVNGEIYANIYTTENIVRFSAETGKVTGWLDGSGLRKRLTPYPKSEVLNGIAHNPKTDRFLITGKYWPEYFEVEIREK